MRARHQHKATTKGFSHSGISAKVTKSVVAIVAGALLTTSALPAVAQPEDAAVSSGVQASESTSNSLENVSQSTPENVASQSSTGQLDPTSTANRPASETAIPASQGSENNSGAAAQQPLGAPAQAGPVGAAQPLTCASKVMYSLGNDGRVWKISGRGKVAEYGNDATKAEDTGITFVDRTRTNNAEAGYNGLAIGVGGKEMYAFRKSKSTSESSLVIKRWKAETGNVETVADLEAGKKLRNMNGPNRFDPFDLVAGAMRPNDSENYWFGGFEREYKGFYWTGADYQYLWDVYFHLYQFKPKEYTGTGRGSLDYVGTVQVYKESNVGAGTLPPVVNGDIDFDASGNMYILVHDNAGGYGKLVPVTKASLERELALPADQRGKNFMKSQQVRINRYLGVSENGIYLSYNGLAVSADGLLNVQSSGQGKGAKTTIRQLDPTTGQVIYESDRLGTGDSTYNNDMTGTDLASCVTPPTLTLKKNLTRKFKPTATTGGDQFKLVISDGDDPSSQKEYANAETTGNVDGLQGEQAGPIVVRTGKTYFLSEKPVGPRAAQDNYNTSFECKSTGGGAVETKKMPRPATDPPDSHTYAVYVPRSVDVARESVAIECTYTNTPKEQKAKLTLGKQVSSVRNGSLPLTALAKPGEFTLSAANGDTKFINAKPTLNESGSPLGDEDLGYTASSEVMPGDYLLAETGNKPAYKQDGDWVCKDANSHSVTVQDSKVTLKAGDDVTCIVANSTAELTLLKDFPNGNPADITVAAKQVQPITGLADLSAKGSGKPGVENSIQVLPGHEYALSESSDVAYLANGLQKYTGPVAIEAGKDPEAVWKERMADNTLWATVNDHTVSLAASEHGIYRFVNKKPPKIFIPLTGGPSRDLFAICGFVLMASGLSGAALIRRRQSRK